ncbi:hypothetical protein Peur_034176 [Populus x canadensis]
MSFELTEITRENKREFVKEGMRCEKQDVPRATLTGFRNLAVITMRRLEKMILRKEEELHQKEPVPATTHNKRKLFKRNHDQDLIEEACPSQLQQQVDFQQNLSSV